MRLLAGDIGGTSTRLALFDGTDDGAGVFEEVESAKYESRQFHGLEPIVRLFLGDRCETVDAAAFGVAGPVDEDTSKATNLPWRLDARRLEREVGIGRARLLNDFEAIARGIPSLGPDDLEILQPGESDPDGVVAIIGAGTGLGEAILVPMPHGLPPRVIASEGGHCDLAPRNEDEIALLRFLLRRHDRVSYERAVSGPGLVTLYEFVTQSGRFPASPEMSARMQQESDAAAVIGDAGCNGTDPAAAEAVRMFADLYAAEAGNLALKCLPTGGVFLAGGIAPKLLPALQTEAFRAAFTRKGRMTPLLEAMQVAVITNTRVGLLGARNLAGTLPR